MQTAILLEASEKQPKSEPAVKRSRACVNVTLAPDIQGEFAPVRRFMRHLGAQDSAPSSWDRALRAF
eukprot:9970053-Alexandrium_andersonii.AAC.1